MFETQDPSQDPVAPPKFESLDEALELVATVGIDEAAPRLIRHFRVPGTGVEFALFFGALDISKQTRLFEFLLNSVFEDSDFSYDKAILSYRKRMSEKCRMRKGDTGSLHAAVSSAIGHSPDSALLFLKSNPHSIKRFIGQLNQQNPDEANRLLSDLVLGLISHIPIPASDPILES